MSNVNLADASNKVLALANQYQAIIDLANAVKNITDLQQFTAEIDTRIRALQATEAKANEALDKANAAHKLVINEQNIFNANLISQREAALDKIKAEFATISANRDAAAQQLVDLQAKITQARAQSAAILGA